GGGSGVGRRAPRRGCSRSRTAASAPAFHGPFASVRTARSLVSSQSLSGWQTPVGPGARWATGPDGRTVGRRFRLALGELRAEGDVGVAGRLLGERRCAMDGIAPAARPA